MTLALNGRIIEYTNQVIFEADFLRTNLYKMTESGALAETLLGFGAGNPDMVRGFSCTPISPPGMSVVVGPGVIYSYQVLDATTYGVLPADTNPNHKLYKQGFNWDPVTLPVTAPATAGQSVIYLVQAQFQTNDVNNVLRPYYNSDNPTQPIENSNYDTRQDIAAISIKSGTPGVSPAPPSPDAGHLGLWYVTITNGQTSVVSGNISPISTVEGAPFITEGLTQKISSADLAGYLTYSNEREFTYIGGIDIGTPNAVVVNPSTPYTTYTGITQIWVYIENNNTGASTINVSGLGAINITKKNATGGAPIPLTGGELLSATYAHFIYNGTSMELQNPAPVIDGTNSFATDTGSANVIVANPIIPYRIYKAGVHIRVLVANNVTASSTLNISSLGAVTIQKMTLSGLTNTSSGDVRSGGIYDFCYDGTVFQLLNPT